VLSIVGLAIIGIFTYCAMLPAATGDVPTSLHEQLLSVVGIVVLWGASIFGLVAGWRILREKEHRRDGHLRHTPIRPHRARNWF